MKKILVLSGFILIVFACHRKTVPSSEEIIISNKVEEKQKTETPSINNSATDITAAGKTIYTTRCNRCHKAKPIEKFTQAEWENILKRMIPKARLNEEQAKQVTAYVMANAKNLH